ncbi:MAG: hypothetical protein L0229_22910, partial [Blastocatellia bacterium]|nr:hypothetical protein [Blastocatellia bacterium]
MAKKDLGKIARRTLDAARFFFEQAGRVEPHNTRYYEYYIEAAIVFACMVLEHLEKEFGKKRGAKGSIRNLMEKNPLIKDLKKKRNSLSHDRSIGTIPSRKEGFYIDEASPEIKSAHEMLLILRAGQNENFSREERLCGVRRPFSFFRDFFLL